MEDPLEHPAIRWFLTIIVFIASFHATWTALEYINRTPKPTPGIEERTKNPEIPSQRSPGVLIEQRSSRSEPRLQPTRS